MKLLPIIRYGLLAALLAALPVIVAVAAPRPAAAPLTAAGYWEQVDDDGSVGGWFHLYERDGVVEGRIVKMFMKPGENPNPICTKCPGAQKNQPTLGLVLIKGMQRNGRQYDKGTIMDPRDGSVYQARMEISPDGQKLMVRGFLGFDLLGKSQIWRRLPDTTANELPPLPGAPGTPPKQAEQPVRR